MIETCAREQLQFSFIPGRGGARVFLYSIAQTVAHLLILRLTFYILYHSLLFFWVGDIYLNEHLFFSHFGLL